MNHLLKGFARAVATVIVLPSLASYLIRAAIVGRDRALEGSTELLSLVPGLTGQYLRRAFLASVLEGGCASSAVIGFGTVFSKAGARIDEQVYVGPRCHLGLVHLEANVMLAAGVHVPSGPLTHGTELDAPMREQPGERRMVTIGEGSWVGSNAVVLADVGRETVVGAGAVVTHALPDRVVAAGVPARIIRSREPCPK